ncbi:MarC family protein [Spartinivicinus ruber]|uniref:MarC family protein n=1 Tax=Spartinivicinus ruber TaxID=2683272 RepID=UPI0013D414D5|nr:MarC family protein [Spartinivicinus ruber]
MFELYHHVLTVFLGFFAIMNPIANTAVFISLTGKEDRSSQIRVACRALIISFFIILVFSILGKAIFHLFGISLPALRIAGGILIFIVGYQMLHGSSSDMHKPRENEVSDISVSPLAVPILAGPGTIATAMNYSATGQVIEICITVVTFAVLCLITFLSFIFGQKMIRVLGESGLSIVTRLMGLILTVIGIQMLITGTFSAIKAFG